MYWIVKFWVRNLCSIMSMNPSMSALLGDPPREGTYVRETFASITLEVQSMQCAQPQWSSLFSLLMSWMTWCNLPETEIIWLHHALVSTLVWYFFRIIWSNIHLSNCNINFIKTAIYNTPENVYCWERH